MVKYIFVTGGSISGLGKGTCASSIGVVLRSLGYRVTAIKIDPYLNVDAGTISPSEHGEVFVLSDGHEGDLDLGNYERALDVKLTNEHNITTGKIFRSIIQSERNGDFLGSTVQLVPHVTDCIQEWILRVGSKTVEENPAHSPDICIVEIGGTVGDIESAIYLEALHHLFSRLPRDDYCLAHVTFIPVVGEEQKTKCAQHSFRALRESGVYADFIFGRSQSMISAKTKRKLAIFSGVPELNVFGLPDAKYNYLVPQQLLNQDLGRILTRKFNLPLYKPGREPQQFSKDTMAPAPGPVDQWLEMAKRLEYLKTDKASVIKIGIVCKYMGSNDTYLSVVKALEHSACEAKISVHLEWIEAEYLECKTDGQHDDTENSAPSTGVDRQQVKKLHWDRLKSVDGILVPGGFGDRGMEGKVIAAQYARENNIPYLGICLGMQTALIDGARNLLGLQGANSEEFDPAAKDKVVIFMPETVNQKMGGTMRLGDRITYVHDTSSMACALYDQATQITERHRHRYEFNTEYLDRLEKVGYQFVGRDERQERIEIIERREHPFFVAVQYHPEFTSKAHKPNPCFLGLVLASAKKLHERFGKYNGMLKAGAEFVVGQ